MNSPQLIQPTPVRTTPKGRTTRVEFLCRINYPPLLSGQRCTITTTGNPEAALTYSTPDVLEAALELLRSLGYDAVTVVPLDEARKLVG